MSASLPAAEAPARRTWRATALVRGSIAVHALAAATLVVRPAAWPWALGAVVADHLLISTGGLLPRNRLLGPNMTRLPAGSPAHAVALTIDDGPDPAVTPQVLALLAAHAVRATFFCIGAQVRAHPGLAREILAHGHAIENHSERHLHRFSLLGPRAMAAEVLGAQESIAAVTGVVPRFFRAPAGLRNPFLEPVLARADLELVSWTRRGFDTVRSDAAAITRRLTRGLAGGDILLVHDGHAARNAAGAPVVLSVLPALLRAIAAQDLTCLTLRAACAGAVPA
jgi:peptidoglycan/xylan/chitin deacetylase (PgdA/CDA1 family)